MKEKEKNKNKTVNEKIAERLERFNKTNLKDSIKSKSVKNTKKINNEEGD